MKINKLIVIIALLSLAATGLIYGRLPAEIAIHFNTEGVVDNWGSKNFIWLLSSLPLLLYGFMLIIPRIDPKRESYKKHTRGYSILANAIALFMIAINWITILYSLGYNLNIQFFILLSIAILFIIIGNYLPNARQNYTFGIRTPWTLADEENWTKTHRLGGPGFVAVGLIALIAAFLPGASAFLTLVSTLIIVVTGLFLYSYLIFRKSRS